MKESRPARNARQAEVATHFDRLRGRLCGLIEACGLEPLQERAMIALIKSLSYDGQEVVEAMLREPEHPDPFEKPPSLTCQANGHCGCPR